MAIRPYTLLRARDAAAVVMSPLPHDLRRRILLRADHKQSKLYDDMRQYELDEIPGLTVSLKGFDTHRCIFVHIPKCAGTSVGRSLFGKYDGNHMGITSYQIIFSKADFDSYFKFTFVRNPWDRVFSAYRYMVKPEIWAVHETSVDDEGNQLSEEEFEARRIAGFERFLTEWLNPERLRLHEHFRPQHRFVCSADGKLKMDFVGRFETIEQDLGTISERLGLEASLVHDNKTPGGDMDYRHHFTPETRRIVADIYRKDIEMFDYSFDG